MDIDFKKLAPWNWFKNEQQEQQTASSLPVQRNDLPAAQSARSCNCVGKSTGCSMTHSGASVFRR